MVFGNLISMKYSVPSFLINARDCFYRCYYLALSYASNKQWPEVVALSRRAQEYVSQSQEVLTADKKQVCSYISVWDLKRCLFHASTTKVTFLPCCKPGFLVVRQCSPSSTILIARVNHHEICILIRIVAQQSSWRWIEILPWTQMYLWMCYRC